MPPHFQHHTATIHAFPARPPVPVDLSSHLPMVDFGSGWYHDAAIQAVHPVGSTTPGDRRETGTIITLRRL